MSNTIKAFVRTSVASVTMASTVLGLGGFAAVAPALAVAPADFGLKEGDVIRATGDVDIYIVNEHGYKRLFVNPAIFNLYGHLGWSKVKEVSPSVRDAFGTSGLFRNCESGDQKVYGLNVSSEDVAALHWVNMSGAAAVAEDANFFKKVFCINNAEQALYGVGADYTALSQIPDYSRGGTSTPAPTAGFNPNGGTQGSISNESVGSPDKDVLMEGQSKVEVFAVDIETENDGPVMLQSVDLWFANTSGGPGASLKPWEVFTKVYLLLDGKVLAEKSANNASSWSDKYTACDFVQNCDSYEYRMRFSGLSGVLPSDETTTLSVALSAPSNYDSDNEGETWEIDLGDHRVLDESGLVVTVKGDEFNTLDQEFTIDQADVAEVDVAEAASPVKSKVVEVSNTSDTNGVLVYSFTMEEKNDVDVTIDDVDVQFTVGGSTTNESNIIRRAMLYEGSTLKSTKTVPDGGLVTFDNVGLKLSGDQMKTYHIKVDLKDTNNQNRYQDGDTIEVSVTDLPTLEDENGNDEADISVTGLALNSPQHQLRVNGINVSLTSVDFTKTYNRNTTSGDEDQGTAVFKFKVTAFGQNAFVTKTVGSHVINEDYGAVGADKSVAITSNATSLTNSFRVDKGTTKDFTLTVVVSPNPNTNGFRQVKVDGIAYGFSDGSPASELFNFAGILDDFYTDPLNLTVTP